MSGPLIETREKRRGVKGSSYAILILKRSERSCITHTHTYNITLLIRVLCIVLFCEYKYVDGADRSDVEHKLYTKEQTALTQNTAAVIPSRRHYPFSHLAVFKKHDMYGSRVSGFSRACLV